MNVHLRQPTPAEIVAIRMRLGRFAKPEPVKKPAKLVWVRPDQNEHVKAWKAWRAISDDYATLDEFIRGACFFAGITEDEVVKHRGNSSSVASRYKVIRAAAARFPGLSSTKLGKRFRKDHTVILYCLNRRSTGKPKRAPKHMAKLNPEQVIEIRRRAATGTEMLKDIAKEYGVVPSTISSIVCGKKWRDLL